MLTFTCNGLGRWRCKQSGRLRRFSSFAEKMRRDTYKRAEPKGTSIGSRTGYSTTLA